MEAFYNYSKFQYESGEYAIASQHLGLYRILIAPLMANTGTQQRHYLRRNLAALWGKLSSDIITENWEQGL